MEDGQFVKLSGFFCSFHFSALRQQAENIKPVPLSAPVGFAGGHLPRENGVKFQLSERKRVFEI